MSWGETPVAALVPGARVLTHGIHGAPIIRTVRASEPTQLGRGEMLRLAFEDGFALLLHPAESVFALLPVDDEPEDLRRLAVLP